MYGLCDFVNYQIYFLSNLFFLSNSNFLKILLLLWILRIYNKKNIIFLIGHQLFMKVYPS